jgi:hypothetical protein
MAAKIQSKKKKAPHRLKKGKPLPSVKTLSVPCAHTKCPGVSIAQL